MSATASDPLAYIRGINATAAFNRWCGIEVLAAGEGRAEIAIAWREDLGQYSGFLHAGLVGALIDTACGFAAATVVGRVLASHYAVNCLRPAVGERFIARARVVTVVFIIFFFTILELPAMLFLVIWIGEQVLFGALGLTSGTGNAGGGVAYFAHIGGFAFGLLAIKLFASERRRRRQIDRVGGLT